MDVRRTEKFGKQCRHSGKGRALGMGLAGEIWNFPEEMEPQWDL